MKNFWKDKKVLVTGGQGFVGSHVVDLLKIKNAQVYAPQMDLKKNSDALKYTKNIDIVLHLASRVAGIQYNITHPVEMFEDNVIMTKNILSASHKNKVERVLIVSSACVYPRHTRIPTPEKDGFIDDPEPTNLGYGWSKRVMELMARFYHQEYGMKIAIARPYNAYGPRDHFDPAISHVIPGLIRRVFENENPLIVWGSGRQTRSFIYVEDLAKGLLSLTEKYAECDPVNIGNREVISIAHLARLIVKLSDKKTKILLDQSKPDGQPRRIPSTKKAQNILQFTAHTPLVVGLKKTISWYKHHLLSSQETRPKVSKKSFRSFPKTK